MKKFLLPFLLLSGAVAAPISGQDFLVPHVQSPLQFDQYIGTSNNSGTYEFSTVQNQLTLSGTVKGEDETLITKGKLFLYQKKTDGSIIFAGKLDPYNETNFNFAIDSHPHTLYFIPDKNEYPDYIPTVYEKTVSVNTSSFLSIEHDTAMIFEILKRKQLATGSKMISGIVANGSVLGRLSSDALQQFIAGAQITLVNDLGEAVASTETDATGYFEFADLPDGTYRVVVNAIVNDALRTVTLDVDLTLNNVEIIVSDLTGDIHTSVKLKPVITFENFAAVTYGDDPILIGATSDSPVVLTYSSSNNDVAIVENGYLNIVGAGTAEITVTSPGDGTYTEVIKKQTLTVNKAAQEISFALIEEVSSFDDIPLTATTTSGLAISFESNHPEIASIENNVIKIHAGGVVEITATQTGNENYLAATPVKETLIVSILGVENVLAEVSVHPNPSAGVLNLSRSSRQMTYSLTDIAGRIHTVSAENDIIDITYTQPGLYLLTITEGSARKVIKVIRK